MVSKTVEKAKRNRSSKEHNMFAWLLIWGERIHAYYYCAHRRFPCKICESNSQKRTANNRAHINSLTLPSYSLCVRACVCLCVSVLYSAAISKLYQFSTVSFALNITMMYEYTAHVHTVHDEGEKRSNNNNLRSSTTKNTNGNKVIEVSSLTDHHHIRENHLTFQRIPINLNHSKLLLTHYAVTVTEYIGIRVVGAYKVRGVGLRVCCTSSRFDGNMLKPIATIT